MSLLAEKIPTLICVDPARSAEMWPHVEWLIERAFWRGRGDETIEDVRVDVMAGTALLWIVWDESKQEILVAGTTKLIETSHGKVCIIATCSGHNMRQWQRFIADLESYAKREGCKFIRLYGRHGWERLLRGYTKPWVTLQKEI